MRKCLRYFILIIPFIYVFSFKSNAQFKEKAFKQSYVDKRDTSGRDSTDAMFTFKEFFGGLSHKKDERIGVLFAGSTVFIGAGQIYNKQYWKLPIIYGGIGAGIGMGIAYRNKWNNTGDEKFRTISNLSFIGAGQIYNKQYWKLPIIYGGIGAGIGMGIAYRNKWNNTGDEKFRTISNLSFIGAGLVYWGTLMDEVINYHKDIQPHAGRATLYSILLPGLGQAYNGEFWKIPIYYGLMLGSAHFLVINNINYHRYKWIHNIATAENSTYDGPISAETALYYRNVFRRYRDYSIVALAGFYLLQIIDANVFSYMQDFELSDDITMNISPTIIDSSPVYADNTYGRPFNNIGLRYSNTYAPEGIGLRIGFTF